MRSHEERIAEVRRMIAEKERQKKAETAADRCYFLHSGMPCGDLRGFLCHVRDFRANGAWELLRI